MWAEQRKQGTDLSVKLDGEATSAGSCGQSRRSEARASPSSLTEKQRVGCPPWSPRCFPRTNRPQCVLLAAAEVFLSKDGSSVAPPACSPVLHRSAGRRVLWSQISSILTTPRLLVTAHPLLLARFSTLHREISRTPLEPYQAMPMFSTGARRSWRVSCES